MTRPGKIPERETQRRGREERSEEQRTDPGNGPHSSSLQTEPDGSPLLTDRLVGLVVKASTSRAGDPGFDFRLRLGFFFSGSSQTSDFKIATPVATLPGA